MKNNQSDIVIINTNFCSSQFIPTQTGGVRGGFTGSLIPRNLSRLKREA